MLNNVDAMTVEIVRAQLDRASQDRVQLQSIPLWRHLARETEKVLHDLLGPLRLLQDHAQVLAGCLRQFRIFHQQVGKTQNGRQGIVDLVGDTGNQLAYSSHFSACTSLSRNTAESVMSVNTAMMLVKMPCSSR